MSYPLVDAFTLPAATALQAQGYQGALSYTSRMTSGQVAAYHRLGLSVGLIAEFDTLKNHPVLGGTTSGTLNGAAAAHQCANLFAPSWVGVIATADTDVQPDQFPTCGAYWDAFRAQQIPGRPIGAYGGAQLIDYLVSGGHADYGMQSGATSWSHGEDSPHAALIQIIEGLSDFDDYAEGHDATSSHLWTATAPTPDPEPDMQLAQSLGRNPKTGEIALFTQGLYDRVSLTGASVTFFEGLGVPNQGNIDPHFFDCTQPIAGGNH